VSRGFALLVNQELLIKLFSRPQAVAHDLDIHCGIRCVPNRQPAQPHHLLSKCLDSHRFAHIHSTSNGLVDVSGSKKQHPSPHPAQIALELSWSASNWGQKARGISEGTQEKR
jgi:hypothetical protein